MRRARAAAGLLHCGYGRAWVWASAPAFCGWAGSLRTGLRPQVEVGRPPLSSQRSQGGTKSSAFVGQGFPVSQWTPSFRACAPAGLALRLRMSRRGGCPPVTTVSLSGNLSRVVCRGHPTFKSHSCEASGVLLLFSSAIWSHSERPNSKLGQLVKRVDVL